MFPLGLAMTKSNKHGEEKCENSLEMAVYDLLTIGEENENNCFFPIIYWYILKVQRRASNTSLH